MEGDEEEEKKKKEGDKEWLEEKIKYIEGKDRDKFRKKAVLSSVL